MMKNYLCCSLFFQVSGEKAQENSDSVIKMIVGNLDNKDWSCLLKKEKAVVFVFLVG